MSSIECFKNGVNIMAIKDYYLILGISRDESAAGVHDAFRELAKKHHPDVAGPESAEHFRNLLEAYKHLSDAQLRARYNHSLQRVEEREESARPESVIVRRRERPEPLVPEPISILRGFETVRPSFDEMADRFLRNFTSVGIPKAERIADLNLEVILSPDEAARGGLIPIGVPSFRPCPLCGGSGRDWLFPCSYCRGEAIIEEEHTISMRIPARLRDGTILELPSSGFGIHNFYIRLHVRIAL
jgi:molecular chaperone DnaJ